ncbi:Hint domain-containing protein [Rubellimicrobium rubrum]|nr:Hint domain-containing protein [Rubellimicrobium rubrum]
MRHETEFRTDALSLTRLAGLGTGSRIRTSKGDLAVNQLKRGDTIVTRNGHRTLLDIEARGARLAPVCILAEALGPQHPAQHLLLGPATRLFLPRSPHGMEVFRLMDGSIVTEESPRGMTLWTLIFREPEVITVEGIEVWA